MMTYLVLWGATGDYSDRQEFFIGFFTDRWMVNDWLAEYKNVATAYHKEYKEHNARYRAECPQWNYKSWVSFLERDPQPESPQLFDEIYILESGSPNIANPRECFEGEQIFDSNQLKGVR